MLVGQQRRIFTQETTNLFTGRRGIGSSAGQPTVGANRNNRRSVRNENNSSVGVDIYAALCIGHVTQGAVIVHGNSGVSVANFALNHGVNLFSFDFLSLLYHIKSIKSIVFYVKFLRNLLFGANLYNKIIARLAKPRRRSPCIPIVLHSEGYTMRVDHNKGSRHYLRRNALPGTSPLDSPSFLPFDKFIIARYEEKSKLNVCKLFGANLKKKPFKRTARAFSQQMRHLLRGK